jgi:hypothetical protein
MISIFPHFDSHINLTYIVVECTRFLGWSFDRCQPGTLHLVALIQHLSPVTFSYQGIDEDLIDNVRPSVTVLEGLEE